jgi:hypothetical protein
MRGRGQPHQGCLGAPYTKSGNDVENRNGQRNSQRSAQLGGLF